MMLKKILFSACLLGAFPVQAQLFNRTVLDDEQTSAPPPVVSQEPAPAVQQAAPAPAPTSTSQMGTALDAYMTATRDLQANFTQIIYGRRGEEKSTGKVWLAKPGKFYWDYQQPNPQKIVSDGRVVYHYDIDLEQVSVRNRDELVGSAAVELLNGRDNIGENFYITNTLRSQAPARLQSFASKTSTIYELKPKSAQNEYDSLWVVLEGTLIKAVMVDGGSSSQTIIAFNHMKRNQGIPASRFQFTPPKGVDVVGNVR